MSRVAAARLLAAAAVLLTIMPYAWGRVFVVWQVVGRPEPRYVGTLLAGLAVVWALTFRLRHSLTSPARSRLLGTAVALWLLANGLASWFATGPYFPQWLVALAYALASLFVFWLCSWNLAPDRGKLARGGLALALLAAFALLFEVEGVTGDSELVNFNWRNWLRPAASNQTFAPQRKEPREVVVVETAADFPQFLGPRRSATVPHAQLNCDWDRQPPRELWRHAIGAGWGGFSVVGDYAFTQEQRGQQECVVCYELRTGAQVWLHADEARYSSPYGGLGPRATPSVASGQVITVGATGILNCLDASSGQERWSVNLLDDANSNLRHGVCASPLVLPELVVVCLTCEEGPTLAAYRRDGGELAWRAGTGRSSYSSPVLVEIAGVEQILLFNATALESHDPRTGASLWQFPWSNSEHINASQPLVHVGGEDQILISTGYAKGAALIRLMRSDSGDWSPQLVWTTRRFKTKFTTPVLYEGLVYGLDDGVLACLDPKSGERLWKAGRYGHGQILLAGEYLLIQSEFGPLCLIQPDRGGLRELGRIDALEGPVWNHLALSGHLLLVRNGREAVCYELP